MPDSVDLIIMHLRNQLSVGASMLANIRGQARSYRNENET